MKFLRRIAELDRTRRGLTVTLILVIGFQLYQLYGLHISKDLPLWDESAYIGWGDEFLQDHKVGSITNAPFYHVLYAGVISAAGLLSSFWVMQYTLKLLLTPLVVLLTYRFSRSAALSLLLGVVFAYSYYHVHIGVLVYYSALIPYIAAILVARRAPVLSLAFSFLAGLGRLEYMAVPAVHLVYLVAAKYWNGLGGSDHHIADAEPDATGTSRLHLVARRPAILLTAAALWAFNIFLLTRITVWQFHNRVWFAWSQNYAFFRYLTGRDSGGNPWLDHQFIAERDFPGAHSLSEALVVNPGAVLEHTWFNLRELPGYLAAFAISDHHAGIWRYAPLAVLAVVALTGLAAWIRRRGVGERVRAWGRRQAVELMLCLGGVIAAAPGVIVSSKTNYIMSLLPAALAGIGLLHTLARRFDFYARWNAAFLTIAAAGLVGHSLTCVPEYSTHRDRGPVYQDAVTMRSVLGPFKGLKILGVSTASYVNYLGRENGHAFIEPLAISPINQQAEDLSLAGLVAARQPDVLLINSHWQSSKTYPAAVAGFDFAGWEPHALRDGTLYTKRGLILRPRFESGWYDEENADGRTWHWSRGDAQVVFANAIAGRAVRIQFQVRSIVSRRLEVRCGAHSLFSGLLDEDARRSVTLVLTDAPVGEIRLDFRTDLPALRPASDDSRALAFCIEDFVISDAPPPGQR